MQGAAASETEKDMIRTGRVALKITGELQVEAVSRGYQAA
jgi:hypothetical protein